MKKKYITLSLIAGLTLFLGQTARTNSSGAPGGSSGSPASNGNTCGRVGCHSGPTASSQTVAITTDIPAAGFSENSSYSITVNANDGQGTTGTMGFQASVETAAGHEGNLTVSNSSRTRKVGNYITHTFSGISASNGQSSWTFDWNSGAAPDQTTVYAVVNFANGTGGTGGDVIVAETLVLNKESGIGVNEVAVQKLATYPNPAKEIMTVATSAVENSPLQIFDLQGKKVLEVNSSAKVDNHHWSINVAALTKGTYILKTAGGQSLRFQKI